MNKTVEQRLADLEAQVAPFINRLERVSDIDRTILRRCREIAMAEVHGLLADKHGIFNTSCNIHDLKRITECMVDNLRSDIRWLAAELGKPT